MKIYILIIGGEDAHFVGYTKNEYLAMKWVEEEPFIREYEAIYEYKAPEPEPRCGCGKPPIKRIVNEDGDVQKLVCKKCLKKTASPMLAAHNLNTISGVRKQFTQ